MRQTDPKKRPGEKTSHVQTEKERHALLRHFESMDQINRALQGKNDLQEVTKDVLDVLLSIFKCDRAQLVYPCDPEASTWQILMERTRPEYTGALPIGVEFPMSPTEARVHRMLLNANGPVKFGPGAENPVPEEMAKTFNVQSFIAMAFYPRIGRPWSFGLHQCSHPRMWTDEDERLFREIGRRLEDALTSLLAYRDLQESEKQIKLLIDSSPVAMIVSTGVDERVESMNDKFVELFGYTIEDIPDVDRWWPLAYPDENVRRDIRSQWDARAQKAIQNKGQIEPMEAAVTCKDGSRRYVEFRLSSIGEKHIVTFIDLTARKQAEDTLQAREQHLQSLLQLSKKLENAQTYIEALNAAHDAIRDALGYQNLWVYLFSEDKKYAKALAANGVMSDAVMSEEGAAMLTIQGDKMLEEISAAREIIVVEDARTDERTNKEIVTRLGNRTIINVPIILFDRHLGSVGTGTFGDEGVHVPNTMEQEYLRSLASHLAITLDRIRLLNERMLMEQELALREQEYRALVENAPDLVVRYDANLQRVYVNPAWEKASGLSASEVIHVNPADLPSVPNPINHEYHEKLQQALTTGSAQSIEFTWVNAKGVTLFLDYLIVPEYGQSGEVCGVLSVGRDITERKRAEEAERRLNRELRAISNCNQTLMRADDEQTLLNNICRIVCEEAGYNMVWVGYAEHDASRTISPAAWAGQNSEYIANVKLSWADDTEAGSGPAGTAIRNGEIIYVQDISTDSRIAPWHEQLLQLGYHSGIALPLKDEKANVFGVLLIYSKEVNAITPGEIRLLDELAGDLAFGISTLRTRASRKQAEDELRESEERFRSFVENANDIVYTISPNGTLTYVSPNWKELLGHEASEVEGRSFETFIHPNDRATCRAILDRTITSGQKLSGIEYRVQHKNGSWQWHTSNASVIRDINGGIVSFLGIARNITERKQAEDALWKSSQMLKLVLENMPAFMFWKDYNSVYLGCNSLFAANAGLNSPEEIVGLTDLDLPWKNSEAESYRADDHMVIKTGTPKLNYEETQLTADGRTTDVRTSKIPLRDPDGNVVGILGTFEDITERKQHEREREAIIAVSTALRRTTKRTEILNAILDQLIDLFDANGATLVLPNPQTGGFIDEMGRGIVGERMVGLSIPYGQGVCNWVIQNKKPYMNNHADQDPYFYRPDLLGNSHCIASVPLITQETVIGAFWIARQLDLTEQDLRLLNAIADIAANAIHRVILNEQTEQQLHHLTALHQIDVAISANLDLNVTLNVILTNVKDELEVDAASILLLDSVTHTLDYAAGLGFRTHGIERSHVRVGDECAGRAALEYRTVACRDLGRRGSFSRFALLAAEAFELHYSTPLVVKGQVKGVLEVFHRKPLEPDLDWINYFEALATQAAIAIESASLMENLQRSNAELMLAYDATIEGWSRALDLRDRETEGHTQRVADMALKLADRIGLSSADKQNLWRGALLHDIGKMGVPDAILLKPGGLSENEWDVMRQHPVYAYNMLSPIQYLRQALDVSYCHHEKWDGSGYPRGLKGEEIPLIARVFAVADVFDALTSDRPYRKAWPTEKVYRYIQEQAGRHFDPQVVKIFLESK